jgi:hypothetical protein
MACGVEQATFMVKNDIPAVIRQLNSSFAFLCFLYTFETRFSTQQPLFDL